MPQSSKLSPQSDAVSRRFFVAVAALATFQLVPSLSGFCELHGLSAPRYREMRLQYGVTPTPGFVSRYKHIEVAALSTLVANYPVSASWLLTGRGEMLTRKP